MAIGMLARAWWDRLRGRLEPRAYPFAEAALLETPLRQLFASPQRILCAFDLKPGERVLEIGPGIGHYSLEAARRIGRRGRLTCLDIQGEMLLETRRRLRAAGIEGAGSIQASAEDLPFAADSFDHVLAVTVLGEIPDRSRALREIRRVLRAGGRLSVSEQLPDPDFITPGTLRRQLHAAGFVEEATRRHFLLAYTSTWRVGKEGVRQPAPLQGEVGTSERTATGTVKAAMAAPRSVVVESPLGEKALVLGDRGSR